MKPLLLLLLIPSLIFSQVKPREFFIGKEPCIEYDPSGFDSTKKYPVVIFLHGLGEMGDGTVSGLNILLNSGNQANLLVAADKYKFIVLAPQLVQSLNGWVPGFTDTWMQPIFDYMLSSMPVDSSHIYVTGLSMGGGGVWTVICGPYAKYIAAAIPICGTPEYNEDFSVIVKNNIHVWAFHAYDDGTVSYVHTTNQVNTINGFKPMFPPLMTIFTTGNHGIWGTVYGLFGTIPNISIVNDATKNIFSTPLANIYTWMLSISKNASTLPPPPVVIRKEMGRIFVPNLNKFITVYDDGTTQ